MPRFRVVLASVALGAALTALRAEEKGPLTDEALRARITKHRTAEVTLTVKDAAGNPLAGKPVTITQQRHKFLFGCNAFGINAADTSEAQKNYQERFAALLNYATLPFYWGAYEPTGGKTGAERVRKMAEWCAKNRIQTKGHPLCWHEVVPKWLPQKTVEEVQALEVGRVTREVKGFAGLIDNWDVANEVVATPNYQAETNPIAKLCRKLGQVEFMKQVFGAAREANPKAILLLNDYDTSEKYAALLKSCLDAGVPIDAIGIQSHMHGGYWGAPRTWTVCERFAKFGKPIFFTETTITSGEVRKNINWQGKNENWPSTPEGETRQAQQVAEFYRVLFSHPAVQGVTWWDFSDRGAWLGAPSGLIHKDMSPKPAYEALMKMVKQEWWTAKQELTTDANGTLKFTGFLGSYSAQAGEASGAFDVTDAGAAALPVKLEAAK